VTPAPRYDDFSPAAFVATEQRVVRRVSLTIVVLAALAPVVALLTGASGHTIVGIVLGGLLSAGNFLAIERISARVVRGTVRTQTLLMGLLVLKMSALMVLVYLLVRTFGVDAIGFVIGLSTLVLGLGLEGLRSAVAEARR